MERKRIEKLIALLLIGILIPVSLFPFRINADTITSTNINGISVTLDEVSFIEKKEYTVDSNVISVDRNYYLYNAEIQFDKSYIGNININMAYTYQHRNDTGIITVNGTKVQKVFVNGDKANMSFGFIANASIDPLWYNSVTFTITNSNVLEYGLISSVEQIVDILTENQDIIDDIYAELQNAVTNTSLANDYLEILTEMRKYDFPIESYNIISYQFANNRVPLDFYNLEGYYTFPRFSINVNENICTSYFYGDYIDVVCLYSNPNGSFGVGNLGTNATFVNSEILNYFIDPLYGNSYLIRSRYRGSGNFRMYLRSGTNVTFIPIFCGYTQNISTDYALLFGLDNRLLNDIHMIAQGTTQSSSASGSLDQTTSQFSDNANDLVIIEESFNNSMNSSLQNVNPTFNMGSSFLTSANWVSQQFNRIVNNTPFSSLITFGLTLGLGLLIIGKVRK